MQKRKHLKASIILKISVCSIEIECIIFLQTRSNYYTGRLKPIEIYDVPKQKNLYFDFSKFSFH